ncbi:alpha/beta fold hydrolase [Leucobacter sp. W1153]|uniref:alpha/beta fold hydrolase n=1 Tax=unclassified Leucobacter TaxID=2621730 RepID=UPI003F33DED9
MTDASPNLRISTLGVDTCAWHYGDPAGAPMILVHGFRGDHHGLDGLAHAIARRVPGIRTIVPDLPGFGSTPAIPGRTHDLDLYGEWLREFAAQVAGDRFAILGHSFGSLVVANSIAAGLTPSNVTLINPISAPALEGPQGALTQLATWYYRAADSLPERPARALLGHPVIVRVMSEVMAKTRDPELRSWIHGQHESYFSRFSDTGTLLQAFRASISHTVAEYAPAVTQPTLLIAGDRDDITPLAEQLSLRNRLRDARLRVIPGVGHLVHYEAVDHAAAEIKAFLLAVNAAGDEA